MNEKQQNSEPKYRTIVYWQTNNVSFYPVPSAEYDRIVKRLSKDGWNVAEYSLELLKKIFAESLESTKK